MQTLQSLRQPERSSAQIPVLSTGDALIIPGWTINN
jgi:hypothetical protein